MALRTGLPQATQILRAISALLQEIGADTDCWNAGVCWFRAGSFEKFMGEFNRLERWREYLLAMRLTSMGKDRMPNTGPQQRVRQVHEYRIDCVAELTKAQQEAGMPTDELVELAYEDFAGRLGSNDNLPVLAKLNTLYGNNDAKFIIHRAMGHEVFPDGYKAHPIIAFSLLGEFEYDLVRRE
jgi:hypothetical protein